MLWKMVQVYLRRTSSLAMYLRYHFWIKSVALMAGTESQVKEEDVEIFGDSTSALYRAKDTQGQSGLCKNRVCGRAGDKS
ncbi:hypothetical protein MTP99_011677 [Tenebrio molitor]|jgi:hypothetical protein|nr:hypothetical protein MTP99_011677 [Tenebrio molitor]